MNKTDKILLLSVDLEDVRFGIPDGLKYKERLPELVNTILEFCDIHNFKMTFFVVGNVARAYPNLVLEIYKRGHEIACHSSCHTPLDKHTPQSFKDDIIENINDIKNCGVENIYGFRAPIFSLTEKTAWAYEILAELGFVYSSSVLPVKNSLYGWSEFGNSAKKVNDSIIEIPMSVHNNKLISIPYSGGVYLRLLPFFIVKALLKQTWKKELPVLSYIHPYDIDSKQEYFMHPALNNNLFLNLLMYYGRKSVMKKMRKTIKLGAKSITYINYINIYIS